MYTRRKIHIVVGEKYGRFTVIGEEQFLVNKKSGWKSRAYLCQDDNGNQRVIRVTSLAQMREVKERQDKESDKAVKQGVHQIGIRRSYFGEYKRNAKKRNIPFEITFEQFDLLIQQNCVYCGVAPSVNERLNKRRHKHQPELLTNGIDRIDSKLGYTKDNCVTCCGICNIMKNVTGHSEFLSQIERIYEFQKQSSTTIESTH